MMQFIKDMFTSNTGVSSKRVSGFIGWLSFIGICIYCTILNIQAPDAIELLAICSSGLLGLETITAIWSRKGTRNQNNHDEYKYDNEDNNDIYIPKSRNKRRNKDNNNEEDLEC